VLGITNAAVTADVAQRSSTADGNATYRQALHEALKLGHNYIGTEHLLLGIVETQCTARDALSELGATSSAVRHQVIALLTSAGVPAVPVATLDDIVKRLEQLERRLPT
jgi:ATP-dependent Clp protease ATP-binding subunit ClpA